jgi:hypothetical protein
MRRRVCNDDAMADNNDMNARLRRRARTLPPKEPDPEPEPPPEFDYGAGIRPPLARLDGNRALNAWIRQQHARSPLAPTTVNARQERR